MPSTDRDDNDDDDDQNSLTASKEKERKRKVLQFDLINSRCTQEDRWRLRAIHFWFLIRFRVFSIYAFCPLPPLLFAAAVGAPYIHFFLCASYVISAVYCRQTKKVVSLSAAHINRAQSMWPRGGLRMRIRCQETWRTFKRKTQRGEVLYKSTTAAAATSSCCCGVYTQSISVFFAAAAAVAVGISQPLPIPAHTQPPRYFSSMIHYK